MSAAFWRRLTVAPVYRWWERCWEWGGCVIVDNREADGTRGNGGGYGKLSYMGFTWRAHRLAYVLTKGPIPPGMVVRHTCDNRLCCNPSHLVLGTHSQNLRDQWERGRR